MKRFIGMIAGLVLVMALPATALADGSVACSTNGAFYTRMGAEAGGAGSVGTVEATLDVQSLNRCNGTDPDSKSGVFVFVEMVIPSAYEYYFAYDQGTASRYGDYVRVGYYLCSWSGDSACGLGHGWFASWGRKAGTASCTGSDTQGISRLSITPFSMGQHHFKLVRKADGSVEAWVDDDLNLIFLPAATSCWNGSTSVRGRATATAWDPGDQIAGAVSNPVLVSDLKVNGAAAANTCLTTASGPYRCSDVGLDDVNLWTIDR
ncbi:MAG TPA: hypothetical protein VFV72_15025 [Candidatus Limnocylindrales bacterium]|nr:hypothetical protein [Candidatus Limnocylindrales bacterium]